MPEHGLVLRRWRASDVDAAVAAVERSYDELHQWMPWAAVRPTAESIGSFLAVAGVEAASDVEMGFGLFAADGELVGGFGLHGRRGPGILEIGYWVRSDRAGRGYATAAAGALTEAAFAHFPEVDRVEIRCDPANRASAAIAVKLGYRLDGVVPADILTPAQTGSQLVWARTRGDAPRSGGGSAGG